MKQFGLLLFVFCVTSTLCQVDKLVVPNNSDEDSDSDSSSMEDQLEEDESENLVEGPDHNPKCETGDDWIRQYPTCAGLQQSPVNIKTNSLQISYTGEVPPLCWKNMDAVPVWQRLYNNGHTIQMEGEWKTGERPTVSCGVFGDRVFEFRQWHCHWARTNLNGSEHTFNGLPRPMECHFVHWDTAFGSFKNAATQPRGLAVIAYVYDIARPATFPADVLGPALLELVKADNVSVLPLPLAVYAPVFTDTYVTYHGSLTTPPCSESVVWIINVKAMKLSPLLMKKFRCIAKTSDCLSNNFRAVQELNGRDILLVRNV